MRYYILTLLVILCCSLYGQTYSSLISDKQIYNFINWQVNRFSSEEKTVSKKIVEWDAIKGRYSIKNISEILFGLETTFEGDKIDSLFTQEDREYIMQQIHVIKDTVWNETFNNTVFENENVVIKKENMFKNTHKTYYYTVPLFSKNKELVIFYEYYYCGPLCASGFCAIYKYKREEEWELLGITGMIVS